MICICSSLRDCLACPAEVRLPPWSSAEVSEEGLVITIRNPGPSILVSAAEKLSSFCLCDSSKLSTDSVSLFNRCCAEVTSAKSFFWCSFALLTCALRAPRTFARVFLCSSFTACVPTTPITTHKIKLSARITHVPAFPVRFAVSIESSYIWSMGWLMRSSRSCEDEWRPPVCPAPIVFSVIS